MSKISVILGIFVFLIVFVGIYEMFDSAFTSSESNISDPNLKMVSIIFHYGLSAILGLMGGGLVERKFENIFE